MASKTAADYSFFSKIRVTGKDRITVLHNILSNDIKNLPTGKSCPAALLTNTGKILIFMEVFKFENDLILIFEKNPQAVVALIDKYIITEDVQLEEVTKQYSFFQTLTWPWEAFLSPITTVISNPEGVRNLEISHPFGRLPAGKAGRNDINIQLADKETAEILRVQAGIPRYGIDMDEETILSETGLEKIAASDTKGCYPGQEVVARIETYRGLNRKLCRIEGKGGIPKTGDKVMSFPHALGGNLETGSPTCLPDRQAKAFGDGINLKEIGWITSAAKTESGFAALGYLSKGYFEAGTTVKIKTERNCVEGKVT